MNGKTGVPGEKAHWSDAANVLIARIKRGTEVKCRCVVGGGDGCYSTLKGGKKKEIRKRGKKVEGEGKRREWMEEKRNGIGRSKEARGSEHIRTRARAHTHTHIHIQERQDTSKLHLSVDLPRQKKTLRRISHGSLKCAYKWSTPVKVPRRVLQLTVLYRNRIVSIRTDQITL